MSLVTRIIICLFLTLNVINEARGFDLFKSGTSDELQYDLDIARLNDLVQLSETIEEYKRRTGKLPLQGQTELPHYVHIATRKQAKYAEGGPPYEHMKTSAKEFAEELINVLGPETQIPFDLQRVPVNKPNFYIYMVMDDVYFLAVHLHQDFDFANKVSDYYYKVEVTNSDGAKRKGTWTRAELIASESFQKALSAEPNKPGYTEALREKLGANDAF